MPKMSICDELGLSLETRAKCKETARRMWVSFLSVHLNEPFEVAYEKTKFEPIPEHFIQAGELALLWHRDVKANDAYKAMAYGGPPEPVQIH